MMKWAILGHLEDKSQGFSFYEHPAVYDDKPDASPACIQKRKQRLMITVITPIARLISNHLILMLTGYPLPSPAMSSVNKGAQSYGDPPVRQGSLSAEEIRDECARFRILIIGKANSGKTTILRKVCNAEPDAKPIVYDAKGKELKVRFGEFALLAKTKLTKNLGSSL